MTSLRASFHDDRKPVTKKIIDLTVRGKDKYRLDYKGKTTL